MTTEFKVGDVVRCIDGGRFLTTGTTYEVLATVGDGVIVQDDTGDRESSHGSFRFELVRRASESQREVGFAVGQRVVGHDSLGRCSWHGLAGTITQERPDRGEGRFDVLLDGGRLMLFHTDNMRHADPAPAEPVDPPQPAPMTRAARVLAGMMADPYQEIVNGPPAAEANRRQEAARLRMARMSLDRPLDAEQARWERLVTARVPVGRR